MQTDDIAAWLADIWDEDERSAIPVCVVLSGGFPAPTVPNCVGRDGMGGCGWKLDGVVVGPFERADHWMEAIHQHNLTHLTDDERLALARIAAERALVARAVRIHDYERRNIVELLVRDLATGYATRPGYNEAWRP